jgi:ubiquinone/menaquinone biosynthesis C-methylase UbiE
MGDMVFELRRAHRLPGEVSFTNAEDLEGWVEAKRPDIAVWVSADHRNGDGMGNMLNAKVVCRQQTPQAEILAACFSEKTIARAFYDFMSSVVGQAVWAKWDFRVAMEDDAEAYARFAEERLKDTYPLTAMRMLGESGIRKGTCIDVGCGPGHLDIELAKMSELTIIGLDIEPKMLEIARRSVRELGLENRISFVVGDVHKMPFPDDFADMIVSRGALPFFEDKKKALQEVYRVLKPTGVAFLGGRYLFTPRRYLTRTDDLRKTVQETGIPDAEVIEGRGQWVKVRGPDAPKGGPFIGGMPMFARRVIADYGISKGECLVVGRAFEGLEVELARASQFEITALYPWKEAMDVARAKVEEAGLSQRIRFALGEPERIHLPDESCDLVVSVGALPFWKDKKGVLGEVYRVLRPGGAALLGGRYVYMPEWRKISSDALRGIAGETGIPSICVIDDMGQWVEIQK